MVHDNDGEEEESWEEHEEEHLSTGRYPVPLGQPYQRTIRNDDNKLTIFLKSTYELVSDPSTDHLIHWSDAGNSFIVVNPKKLGDILDTWFRHRNFASMVRQLNMYNFHKVRATDRWEFMHPLFLRGGVELLYKMKRKNSKRPQGDVSRRQASTRAAASRKRRREDEDDGSMLDDEEAYVEARPRTRRQRAVKDEPQAKRSRHLSPAITDVASAASDGHRSSSPPHVVPTLDIPAHSPINTRAVPVMMPLVSAPYEQPQFEGSGGEREFFDRIGRPELPATKKSTPPGSLLASLDKLEHPGTPTPPSNGTQPRPSTDFPANAARRSKMEELGAFAELSPFPMYSPKDGQQNPQHFQPLATPPNGSSHQGFTLPSPPTLKRGPSDFSRGWRSNGTLTPLFNGEDSFGSGTLKLLHNGIGSEDEVPDVYGALSAQAEDLHVSTPLPSDDSFPDAWKAFVAGASPLASPMGPNATIIAPHNGSPPAA